MGRKPMIAGNWKMYKTPGEAAVLAQAIDELLKEERGLADRAEAVVCPPSIDLKSVSAVINFDKSDLQLSAQNVHWEEEGAFTGESVRAHARRRGLHLLHRRPLRAPRDVRRDRTRPSTSRSRRCLPAA